MPPNKDAKRDFPASDLYASVIEGGRNPLRISRRTGKPLKKRPTIKTPNETNFAALLVRVKRNTGYTPPAPEDALESSEDETDEEGNSL